MMPMRCNYLSNLWKLLYVLAVVVLGVNFYRDYVLDSHVGSLERWLFFILLFGSLIVRFAGERCSRNRSG